MANSDRAVGCQTPLQEHVNKVKLGLEQAAERLTEEEWLTFASITELALKFQRAR